MYQFIVQGATREALIVSAVNLIEMLGGNSPLEVESTAAVEQAAGAKRGPGRPAKGKAEEAAKPADIPPPPAKAPNPFEDAAPAPKTYTLDQVKAALMEVAKPRTGDADESVGYARVAAILDKVAKVKTVKELDAKDYPAVMSACGLG